MTDPDNHILLADDEQGIRDTLGTYLRRSGYAVTTAANGYEALECLERGRFFLVVTDITMPNLNGLELLRHVRENYPATDVVMITGNVDLDYAIEALRAGAYDYFQKPLHFDTIGFAVERVRERQRMRRAELEIKTLKTAAYETVIGFVQAVEEKDSATKGHSERVAQMTEALGAAIGLGEEALVHCRYAGLLHDVGKIGIPETILNKPSKLTDGEFTMIKEHPVMGARILEPITFLRPVAEAIRAHHENFDGTGYPDRLAGDAIPLIARLVRIADVFDGLAMDRPYRAPVKTEDVVRYIVEHAGTLFDPELAEAFVQRVVPTAAKEPVGA